MRDDTVTLELAGIQVTATIGNAESFPSPHTGRPLERLQVRFAVDGEATNDQVVKALEANQLDSSWEDIDPVVAGRRRRRYYQLSGDGAEQARQALRQAQQSITPTPSPGLGHPAPGGSPA